VEATGAVYASASFFHPHRYGQMPGAFIGARPAANAFGFIDDDIRFHIVLLLSSAFRVSGS
jgi:hypothetical protein